LASVDPVAAIHPADPFRAIIDRLPAVAHATRVLAVAGPVAVGKSTVAAALAERLRAGGLDVEVVSTDGFLLPNAALAAQGLLERKGCPETYDLTRLEALVGSVREGRTPLEVPVYSHDRYDVLEAPVAVDRPDVLVVEGVVALQRPLADLGVYIQAEESDVIAWYVARFQSLVHAARDDPTSFYRGWIDLDEAAVAELARAVWNGVNHPNLHEHIAPTRALADVVVHKGPDHRILSLEWVDP